MSVQLRIERYRGLLQEKVDLQKRDLDLSVEIQVCEKEMELEAMLANAGISTSGSETEDFIERNKGQLEPDDFEFLEEPYRGTAEVAFHTSISQSELKRLAKDGVIDCEKRGRAWKFKTVSVVRYLIDAKTEEET